VLQPRRWEESEFLTDKMPRGILQARYTLKVDILYWGDNAMLATRVINVELLILAALETSEWLYGLSISERILETTGQALSPGSLYVTLHRMEEKGLVSSRWGEATEVGTGARRRYYQLTELGLQTLIESKQVLIKALNLTPGLVSVES
jgi:PadR family transcriptional regulator PadR